VTRRLDRYAVDLDPRVAREVTTFTPHAAHEFGLMALPRQ
jgi:hypothetical protein